MTTSRVETLPAIWDDARDLPFFRLTARLFSPEFCFGAGVLLASYDTDPLDTVPAGGTATRTGTATPASADSRTRAERDPIAIRVRRTR